MKTLLDYKNSCRICLRSDVSPTNVYHYSIAGYQKPLAEIIFALFKIKVVVRKLKSYEANYNKILPYLQWQKHPAFPSLLCRRCSIEMEQIILFKKEIEQNELHLSKLFQNTKSSFTCATKVCNFNLIFRIFNYDLDTL